MEGALKWRGRKSGQRYFQQREGRAGVVVVSLTRRAKRLGSDWGNIKKWLVEISATSPGKIMPLIFIRLQLSIGAVELRFTKLLLACPWNRFGSTSEKNAKKMADKAKSEGSGGGNVQARNER